MCLIPGVVFKFLPVAASQNNPLARWQFSESFLSALASMPCICFSKCFRDGCANFIWLFSSVALTCCCTYSTLFWVCCLSVDVFELFLSACLLQLCLCTQGVPRASDPKHLSPFCSFLLFHAFGYDQIGKSDSILCA